MGSVEQGELVGFGGLGALGWRRGEEEKGGCKNGNNSMCFHQLLLHYERPGELWQPKGASARFGGEPQAGAGGAVGLLWGEDICLPECPVVGACPQTERQGGASAGVSCAGRT